MKTTTLYFLILILIFLLSSCLKHEVNGPYETIQESKESIEDDSVENKSVWDSCPINITGGISGSSYSEIIELRVSNMSPEPIDSVKIMITFTDTDNYSGSPQVITGFYTIETIWGNEAVSTKIGAYDYNFLRAEIYPVCIYFKNGDIWGDPSAESDEIIKHSKVFKIEHFGLNTKVVYEHDISSGT